MPGQNQQMAASLSQKGPAGFTHNRREAAEYLGVSYGTLGNWGSSRINIPFAVVGGEAWYRQSDLDHYLFRREVKVSPPRQVGTAA